MQCGGRFLIRAVSPADAAHSRDRPRGRRGARLPSCQTPTAVPDDGASCRSARMLPKGVAEDPWQQGLGHACYDASFGVKADFGCRAIDVFFGRAVLPRPRPKPARLHNRDRCCPSRPVPRSDARRRRDGHDLARARRGGSRRRSPGATSRSSSHDRRSTPRRTPPCRPL